jgi:DNA-binding beta-propeller fold protein YncE
MKLEELDCHVNDLKASVGALTGVAFTVGRCERLTTEQLGGVIIQRRPNTEQVPRMLLPGKCLTSFDSRRGKQSDYMATGLSLTKCNDIIVTDTGLDMVNVFSAAGELKLNVNIQPEDYPTTAVQFKDTIAVACCSQVKLYDMVEGVYHPNQLPQSVNRPQGVATDSHGHLVVTAQRVDLPAVGIYDQNTHLMTNIIIGDTECCMATEDVLGCEIHDTTNKVLFSKPWYVAVDQSDQLVISDRDSHTIRVVSRSGVLIEEIGTLGHKPGQFFHPAGLCVDPHGRIIVADSQNHRVQVVTPGESLVISIVTQEHDGIECPMDVALDCQGRLYVLQGDGLVRVYQYC